MVVSFFFFQAEDGIRDKLVTGVQTCALPISTKVTSRTAGAGPATLRCGRRRCPGSKRVQWLGLPPGGTWRKIGRASWRERGEISVVAVSLKKKKKKTRRTSNTTYRRRMDRRR